METSIAESELGQLIKQLAELLDLYDSLRTTLTKQQEDLLDRDLDGLEERTRQQQEILSDLEPKRISIQKELEQLLGQQEPPPKIEDLYGFISDDERQKRLRKIRRHLDRAIRDVQRLNDENSVLLSSRLQAQERLFGLFQPQGDGPDKTYDRDLEGEASDPSGSVLFDEAI